MKKALILIASLLGAAAIVLFLPFSGSRNRQDIAAVEQETSLLSQTITGMLSEPEKVHKLYSSGQLVGVLSDVSRLDAFLNQVYEEQYAADFPDSSVSLGKDVYMTEELSYFVYENIDDQILNYLQENSLFTLQAVSVEFSDDDGVYAEIFVKNQDIYEEAMQEYLSCFIDPTELAQLNSGQTPSALTSYGSHAIGISIAQTITVSKAYAAPSEIRTTMEEVLEYLEYGDHTEKQYYTVQKYDTVAGVGAKNYGLSATQVMNINRDKISSVDQVLSEGEVLCVTYFNSPIDIIVTKESLRQETVYADTDYVENAELRQGVYQQVQEGVDGYRNALYRERWVNGVLMTGTLQSSVEVQAPVNAVVEVGTMQPSGVGTGSFRWPVDNPTISCQWGCYYGHRAIDIQNMYNRWDVIYAADSGIIEENSYNSINGNYVVIDHQNGLHTYYGHMITRSPLEVGTIVEKGDVIGSIGMTGAASGPHVHFFIFDDEGIRYNPCDGFLNCG